jgi:thioredoxin reductase (NADPH)
MENIIIIGSGPAGHTAAIYAARANLNPLLFEGFMAGGVAAGGQLTTTTKVENFPGFPNGIQWFDLMMNMREQAINVGTRIETKTIDKVDFSGKPLKVYSGNEVYEAKSIIIATGAIAKRLGITGEKEYRQKGISACAVCEWALPIFKNKVLVVIGGWDVAMEEAIHLTHFASKVIVLVRSDKLRASEVMQERAKANDKIEFKRFTEAKEALGDGNLLTGLKVINNQTQEELIIECWGLFYAIGHKPNTDFLDGQITLDTEGYIITKYMPVHTATNVEGVFAAGDVADKKYRQAITSAASWCMAALETQQYLQDK